VISLLQVYAFFGLRAEASDVIRIRPFLALEDFECDGDELRMALDQEDFC